MGACPAAAPVHRAGMGQRVTPAARTPLETLRPHSAGHRQSARLQPHHRAQAAGVANEKAPCYHDRGQVSHSELHQLALNLSTALSTNTPDPLVPASSCTPAAAHAAARAAHHPAGARSDPAPPHQAPPANPASDHTQTSTHHHLVPLHHAADPSRHQRATRSPAASRWPCQRAAHPIALQPPVDQRPTAHQRLLLSAPLPMPP